MGIVGIVVALFTVGYVVGVWTACLVFHQSQQAYEEGSPGQLPSQMRPSRSRPLAFVQIADAARQETRP